MTMQLFLHSTDQNVDMQGHKLQVWKGRDLLGRRCEVFILAIQTRDDSLAEDRARLYADNMIVDLDASTGDVLEIREIPPASPDQEKPLSEGASSRVEVRADAPFDFQSWLTETVKRYKRAGTEGTPDLESGGSESPGPEGK